jgi:predicted oxidoreductase (fatty acid repression mutant protein)
MKDKNDWIMQGIKISCKHKRNLYAFTNNNKAKAHYTKYCKIIIKAIKEARKQHYCRLIAISNNKMKKTWNVIKKETGKVHSVEQFPTFLVNVEKLRDQTCC